MEKNKLNFWQIWNMSFGFLGIQFGFALQNANTSRIFQTLGANVDDIPILWIAAPITGLLVQPVIGYYSDRTWGKFGRRKPFFLIGAILASLCLFLMPQSPVLWMAAGMLWIMDTSFNISMEPFRALVADKLPSSQRTLGFVVQSFFIGIGAFVASSLPWILTNWFGFTIDPKETGVTPAVKYSFYIGAIAFLIAIIWTVSTTKEYPPENLEEFEESKRKEKGILNLFKEVFGSFFAMPKAMIQLAFVQFFSWFALFAMWIYTTPAVTKHIYGVTEQSNKVMYEVGANWVGVLMGYYNLFAAAFAFLIPVVAKYTSRRMVHLICLVLGGFGLISFYFVKDPTMLIFSEIGIGIAWASILSMPYAILAGSLPAKKMGLYMGLFNFFIVLPQISAAAILGFIVKQFFGNEAIYALIIGGVSLFIAGALTLIVEDKDDVPVLK